MGKRVKGEGDRASPPTILENVLIAVTVCFQIIKPLLQFTVVFSFDFSKLLIVHYAMHLKNLNSKTWLEFLELPRVLICYYHIFQSIIISVIDNVLVIS
jgi:hypothetical protein